MMLLSLFGNVLEALINWELVKYLNTQSFLSDKQCGFRFSRATADELTIIAERDCQALDKNDDAQAFVSDMSKTFDRVWHAGVHHNLKSYISGYIFD